MLRASAVVMRGVVLVGLAVAMVGPGCVWDDVCVGGTVRMDGRCVHPADGGPDAVVSPDAGDAAVDGPLPDGGPIECVAPTQTRCGTVCVDTSTDPDHCGMCDEACPDVRNATPACRDSACAFDCLPTHGDCDSRSESGCETPLDTVANCGRCGVTCDGSGEFCRAGDCRTLSTGWSRSFGGPGIDRAVAMGLTASGRVVVGGTFDQPFEILGTPLAHTDATDMWVVRYDGDGNHRGPDLTFGGTGDDKLEALCTDGSGHTILAGSFTDRIQFADGPELMAGSTPDLFVASLRSDDSHEWSTRFAATASTTVVDAETDAAGNVYLLGRFTGTLNLGGEDLVQVGDADTFVASFDPRGSHRWSDSVGASGSTYMFDVAVDGPGNVYLTGTLNGSLTFAGGDVPGGDGDLIVLAYASDGMQRFASRYGSGGFTVGHAVTTDEDGNVYLVGGFTSSIDFGGGALSARGDVPSDLFLASFDVSGGHRWSYRIAQHDFDAAYRLDAAAGAVYLSGSLQDLSPPGGGVGPMAPEAQAWVASFTTTTGTLRWVEPYGDAGYEGVYGLAVTDTGRVHVVGEFTGTLATDDGPLNATSGTSDAFVIQLRE